LELLRLIQMATGKAVLVTGANKGIGLAITRGLLEAGCFVFLGSRDVSRGEEAARSLGEEHKAMVQVVQLDVMDDLSVSNAFTVVKEKCGVSPLYGLVNNAGGAGGMKYINHENHEYTLELNIFSAKRVTSAFLPLFVSDGRIVMVGSGAAPSFVSSCSVERQAVFTNPACEWVQLKALIDDAHTVSASDVEDKAAAFRLEGLGDGASYGMSKAALATYSMIVARENADMKVNCCSPGFIETDLTRPFAKAMGKTPSEMGMQPVEKGAFAPLFLTLGDVATPPGTAWFWGSDAQRSPLDKYRSPGDPPYTGGVANESAQSMASLKKADLAFPDGE